MLIRRSGRNGNVKHKIKSREYKKIKANSIQTQSVDYKSKNGWVWLPMQLVPHNTGNSYTNAV